jgi:hypothetical protein
MHSRAAIELPSQNLAMGSIAHTVVPTATAIRAAYPKDVAREN